MYTRDGIESQASKSRYNISIGKGQGCDEDAFNGLKRFQTFLQIISVFI